MERGDDESPRWAARDCANQIASLICSHFGGAAGFVVGENFLCGDAAVAGGGDLEFAAVGECDSCGAAVGAGGYAGDGVGLTDMQGDEEREQELRAGADAGLRQSGGGDVLRVHVLADVPAEDLRILLA